MPKGDAERIEKTVIQRLRDERLKQGLSYEQLAAKTGLHRTGISMIERGERRPLLVNVIRIAEALGVGLRDLLK